MLSEEQGMEKRQQKPSELLLGVAYLYFTDFGKSTANYLLWLNSLDASETGVGFRNGGVGS